MLLQALNEFYTRATAEGKIDEAAFNPKVIRWIIPLDREGNLEGDGLIETTGEGKRAKEFKRAPRTSRPKVAGGIAEFMADGFEAVFGLPSDLVAIEPNEKKQARQVENLKAKRGDFWRQVKEATEAEINPSVAALVNFAKEQTTSESPFVCVPPFLRFGLPSDAKPKDKPCWWVKTAAGDEVKLAADNFTFQVDGEILLDEPSVQDYWRAGYASETEASEAESERGLCLVTGNENVAVRATHLPKISGVPGATPTGALLISFDKESFTSYGFSKSYNAPVSSQAVSAYANGLNHLLRDRDHSCRLGNTALLFWAKQSDSATTRLSRLLDRPRPEAVRRFLRAPFEGDGDSAPLKHDRFYSVTLGGNSGRVVVRHWMQTTVEEAINNFRSWFEDLNIVTLRESRSDEDLPLSLYRLALSTVREAKDLSPEIPSQLYRAALEGSVPSLVVAKKILDRLAVDLAREGVAALNNLSRFALLKLVINRNRKEGDYMVDVMLAETDDAAYNCGRLLAIFDDLQAAAHDYKLEGAGVVERYYGTASSAPNSAFGILWRLHQHHLKKIARAGDAGRAKAEAMKKKIELIAALFRQTDARFPPQFPRSFDLRAQGRFALGFYQQKASDRQARRAYLDKEKTSAADDSPKDDAATAAGDIARTDADATVDSSPSPDSLASSNTSQGDSQ